jgi:hypothetical protein
MTERQPTILRAMDDERLWRRWFRDPATWAPWRAFLAVLFGLPLDEAGLALYRECTGRTLPPEAGFTEAWLAIGRRGGKSVVLALVACYLAVFRDWRAFLSPGERGTIKVMACDRRQARVIHRYARALLTEVPALAQLVAEDNDDEIVLNNRVVIEIQTASFRAVRGFTVIACLLDEIAFWRSDEASANPDAEIIAAIRPAMATIPGTMFLAASSPYAKRGELWNSFRRWHGHDDAPALVWHAPTRTMNPTVPPRIVDEAIARDPDAASAEFLAQFRTDIESYISREVVEALVEYGRFELPARGDLAYGGFVDVSGGASDAFAWAIGHLDGETVVVDLIREVRPPFSPAAVVAEAAADFARYSISSVRGDYYGAEWTAERFREHGITYTRSEKPKSIIYQELLPLLMSGRVELLDHPRAIHQLISLERRHHRGGKDVIDHPPSGSDDCANALAGMAVNLTAVEAPCFWNLDRIPIAHV